MNHSAHRHSVRKRKGASANEHDYLPKCEFIKVYYGRNNKWARNHDPRPQREELIVRKGASGAAERECGSTGRDWLGTPDLVNLGCLG